VDYRERLAKTGEVIPLNLEILELAAECERTHDLRPQDAIVYASVRIHLDRDRPSLSCFLNKNVKDFDIPTIETELRCRDCKMIPRFDQGLSYIQAMLRQ